MIELVTAMGHAIQTAAPSLKWAFTVEGRIPSAASPPVLELVVDDIVEETTEAIVVPTDGFVDLAIRRVAGEPCPKPFAAPCSSKADWPLAKRW